MFVYCNSNPVRYVDSNGNSPIEIEKTPYGGSITIHKRFCTVFGKVTVVVSYEAKIIDGYTFVADCIEIEITESNLSVKTPDGMSFVFNYDWFSITADSFTKTLSEEKT